MNGLEFGTRWTFNIVGGGGVVTRTVHIGEVPLYITGWSIVKQNAFAGDEAGLDINGTVITLLRDDTNVNVIQKQNVGGLWIPLLPLDTLTATGGTTGPFSGVVQLSYWQPAGLSQGSG